MSLTRKDHLKIQKTISNQIACARTIHRSQGLTLDNVAFDPTGIRIHGLVYTTLSHVRNIESLYLSNPLTKITSKSNKKLISKCNTYEVVQNGI
jgi:ATP-dependent exoDNAse (exonuclease V) alpha subunit